MDIEFDNDKLRNNFDTVGESGKLSKSPAFLRNLPAINKQIARAVQPVCGAIGHHNLMEGCLPALCPFLDASVDLGEAFDWAMCWGNTKAAKICLGRGVDPTKVLKE